MARQCKRLFQAKPMPELPSPRWEIGLPKMGQAAFAGGDGNSGAGPFVVIGEK
jgi:hypothetical protein